MNEEKDVKGMTTGMVLDIQRFSLNDGPGIRTTVFLKGCPLRCAWCHNPESMNKYKEIAFFEERCVLCGKCKEVCTPKSHELSAQGHTFQRPLCNRCGQCTRVCAFDALRLAGEEMDSSHVLEEILKDKPYYATSGGGLTVSGGEPLYQLPFLKELLEMAKAAEVHTCVETSGHAPTKSFEDILPFTDLFLFDYKHSDDGEHKKYTGASNHLILKNLEMLCYAGAQIELRCPVIPGVNQTEEHFRAIVKLSDTMPAINKVWIMPYHNTGVHKVHRYGYSDLLPHMDSASEADKESWLEQIRSYAVHPAKIHIG